MAKWLQYQLICTFKVISPEANMVCLFASHYPELDYVTTHDEENKELRRSFLWAVVRPCYSGGKRGWVLGEGSAVLTVSRCLCVIVQVHRAVCQWTPWKVNGWSGQW